MKSLISILAVCTILIYSPVMLAEENAPATGIVAESEESGDYVYIKFEDGIWIAAKPFAVSKGDKVQYSGAVVMNDFHNKLLDRTFESILFVFAAGIVNDDAIVEPATLLDGNRPNKKPAVVHTPATGEIKPLEDGKTIADIYAESDQLKGQVLSLSAKVVKVNQRILGKNWITLQDGSGTKPENKIVATSQEMPAPGDLVIVKGTLVTDVELGRGYSYKVMLEEATFSAVPE